LVNKEYKVEDIFEDIEGDEENVLMNIPEEIRDELGWKEGDVLRISVEEGSIVLEKVDNGKE
jgi:AbrB family looped-hinge helix DNA binding protein